MSAVIEGALQAWEDCNTSDGALLEVTLCQMLPLIANHIPRGRESEVRRKKLEELFAVGRTPETALFLQMARVHEGKVHFLNFWRAFSEASRLVAATDENITCEEDLFYELETLRDRVLRLLDAGIEGSPAALGCPITIGLLLEVLNSTKAMSCQPDFWQLLMETLQGLETDEVDRERLTCFVLFWVSIAANQAAIPMSITTLPTPFEEGGLEVLVHIYDVDERFIRFNKFFAHKQSPLKFGGVFHAGVVVNGLEWAYGCEDGVNCTEPKDCPQYQFRQVVPCKNTQLSPEDVAGIISDLVEEYPGDDYDLLREIAAISPMISANDWALVGFRGGFTDLHASVRVLMVLCNQLLALELMNIW